MRTPAAAPLTVIGDGLAARVLSLCLARRGGSVRLIGGEALQDWATTLTYGALPRGRPSRSWRHLERLHGPLGWQPSGLVFHDHRPGLPRRLAALTRRMPLPLARVDAPTWGAASRRALAAAGVEILPGWVRGLQPRAHGGWQVELESTATGRGGLPAETLLAETVVLAAGAGCRSLWPSLPARLRHSWAGVLLLEGAGPPNPWLAQTRRGRVVQPRHWQRPALEASAATLAAPGWIVDAGLAPWGEGAVVGQISWIPPLETALGSGTTSGQPDPLWMEERLREGLGQLDPQLALLQAPYRQAPVSFCTDGQPLVGPVAGAPGLWVFAGFRGAFSCVPSLAERLAASLLQEQSHAQWRNHDAS